MDLVKSFLMDGLSLVELEAKFREENVNVKNLQDSLGNTALHYAAKRGNLSLAYLLLKKFNVNVNKRNRKGDAALEIAVMYGHLRMCMLLVNYGAEIQDPETLVSRPLYAAAAFEKHDIFTFLVECGVSLLQNWACKPTLLRKAKFLRSLKASPLCYESGKDCVSH